MPNLLRMFRRFLATVEFLLFYLWEVVQSNVRVAFDVMTPRPLMRPALFRVSTDGLSERQVLALANLVSMTPGTLSLELESDDRELLIHGMYVDDPVAAARNIETRFIPRIRNVF